MFSSVIGSIGSWERAIIASSDGASARAGDDEPHEDERLAGGLHGPGLGFRVAGADEPYNQGRAEAVRTQDRIGEPIRGFGEQLQRSPLCDRQFWQ
jgi:hypothetical protein